MQRAYRALDVFTCPNNKIQGSRMVMLFCGVVANLVGARATYLYFLDGGASQAFMTVMQTALTLLFGMSFVGAVLVACDERKLGGVLVILGSILFVPLGLIAIAGAGMIIKAQKTA